LLNVTTCSSALPLDLIFSVAYLLPDKLTSIFSALTSDSAIIEFIKKRQVLSESL
jgi:hypothetical protein